MSRDDLDRLRTIVGALSAEVQAYRAANLPMPRVRIAELRESLEPLAHHTQPHWNVLPPESLGLIQHARARMVAAQQCDAPGKFCKGKAR